MPKCTTCGNTEHFSLDGTELDARTYTFDGMDCVDSKSACCEETSYKRTDRCTCDNCGASGTFDKFGYESLWDDEPAIRVLLFGISDEIIGTDVFDRIEDAQEFLNRQDWERYEFSSVLN